MKPYVELQSLVDTHEQPFVVIDKDLKVVALNRAYERAYRIRTEEVLGRPCYEVSHGMSQPCFELGEDCPHRHVMDNAAPHSCLHNHSDSHGREHWVRVNMFPLRGPDGSLYFGESIRELTPPLDPAQKDQSKGMVGRSQVFLTMLEQLRIAARSNLPVLLLGETGTGKELAARFLHEYSDRKTAPLQTVDCTVLNESLVESELFGHEKGAFTGNAGAKKGLFEIADGGTLFLDEIGDLPVSIQPKLLRVLESGEFRRVGGHHTKSTDVRVICATNRHLWTDVEHGNFREDLYYRIACLTVHVPALRERMEDLPFVAGQLLKALHLNNGKDSVKRLSEDALTLLMSRDFRGNIRELRNLLFGAASLTDGRIVEARHITEALQRYSPAQSPAAEGAPKPRADNADEQEPMASSASTNSEPEELRATLQRFYGHRGKAAQHLGISTRTLYRRMKKFGIG